MVASLSFTAEIEALPVVGVKLRAHDAGACHSLPPRDCIAGVSPSTQTRQHPEINWILGRYPLMSFSLQPDALSVVERQMREAEAALMATNPTRPTTLTPCNVAWDNLFARAGAVAYLASGLATPPPLRESLLGLLSLWQGTAFCRTPERFRIQLGTLHAPLPKEELSQWIVEHEGTTFLIKLLSWIGAGTPGAPIDMIVSVLSYRTTETFSAPPSFTPRSTLLGSDARLQKPEALVDLVGRVGRDGPPKWAPAIGDELARLSGLTVPAAALLWAGNTEASNSLKVVAAPETRKALGLQAKQVDAASATLRALHATTRASDLAWWYNISGDPMPRQAFYDIYQAAMPDAPGALWAPLEGGDGSVVARLARAYARSQVSA
jgi:hypothetical protein